MRRDYLLCLLVLVVIQAVVSLTYLDRIPRVFVDEAWDSGLACNLAENGKLANKIITGHGGIDVHFIQNRLVQAFVSAGIFKLFGCTIFTSRFGSVIFSVIAICSLFALMSRWFGIKQAFWVCLATIINPWFFEVSRRARPEIYYTALAVVLLLVIDKYFENGSRKTSLLAGVIAALLSLTHCNGILAAFCIGLSSIICLRNKSLVRLFLWGFIGFAITTLPYFIHLFYSLKDPSVNFYEQMQTSGLRIPIIIKELSRWKHFFDFPKLILPGLVIFISWIYAWFSRSKEDKTLFCIMFLYPFVLPFASVSQTPYYLIFMIPFSTALLVRLIWCILFGLNFRCKLRTIKIVACYAIIAAYAIPCMWSVSMWFYCLKDADFNNVVNEIALVVKPEDYIWADPIFWFGSDKYKYAPYLITYDKIPLREYCNYVKRLNCLYAIRTSWYTFPPLDKTNVLSQMPEFRKDVAVDWVCKRLGTKIHEFYDPYYGYIEIYKLR